MNDPDAYVMLISSLPRPEALFLAKQPPLTRLKLDRRLRVLTPEDAETLRLIEITLDWRHWSMKTTEDEVIVRARRTVGSIESETLRQTVRDRMEIRTCVVALRRRARGEGPPSPGTSWGFGRWVGHIVRNWTEPTFRLDGVFPWLRDGEALITHDDPNGFERLVLEQSFKQLQRHAGQHLFDFEAVALYVLKWSIVDRWARYNAEAAARRFEDLTQAGLGKYEALDFQGDA